MVARKRMRVSEKCVGAVRRGIYVERGGANGRALDYWLQAAAELKRLLRRERYERRKNRSILPSGNERPEAKIATGVRK